MNKKQLAALWSGIGLIVIGGLLAPRLWFAKDGRGGSPLNLWHSAIQGYCPDQGFYTRIDWGRLLPFYIIVVIISGLLIYALREK